MRNYKYKVEHLPESGEVQTWRGAAYDCFDALISAAAKFGLPSLDIDAPEVTVDYLGVL